MSDGDRTPPAAIEPCWTIQMVFCPQKIQIYPMGRKIYHFCDYSVMAILTYTCELCRSFDTNKNPARAFIFDGAQNTLFRAPLGYICSSQPCCNPIGPHIS